MLTEGHEILTTELLCEPAYLFLKFRVPSASGAEMAEGIYAPSRARNSPTLSSAHVDPNIITISKVTRYNLIDVAKKVQQLHWWSLHKHGWTSTAEFISAPFWNSEHIRNH